MKGVFGENKLLLVHLTFNALVPACTKQNFRQLRHLSQHPAFCLTTKAAGGLSGSCRASFGMWSMQYWDL